MIRHALLVLIIGVAGPIANANAADDPACLEEDSGGPLDHCIRDRDTGDLRLAPSSPAARWLREPHAAERTAAAPRRDDSAPVGPSARPVPHEPETHEPERSGDNA